MVSIGRFCFETYAQRSCSVQYGKILLRIQIERMNPILKDVANLDRYLYSRHKLQYLRALVVLL